MTIPTADALEAIVAQHERSRSSLIPLLQQIQRDFSYLPEWALQKVAAWLRVPPSQVFGVTTFYAQFRLTPQGRNLVRVCRGTACHVRGGPSVRQAVEEALGVAPGQTTADMGFTFETVACIGACALAPTMVINETTYGEMTKDKALRAFENALL